MKFCSLFNLYVNPSTDKCKSIVIITEITWFTVHTANYQVR